MLPQAKGAAAQTAIEMHVLVGDVACAIVGADGIFQGSASVVDGVDERVVEKNGDGAENGGFIHRNQGLF